MKTTGLLVVFSLLVVIYQASAVPVASSFKLENGNTMNAMEAKHKSEESDSDDRETEEEADKDDERQDEEKENEEDEKREDEKDEKEEKEDEDRKEDEEKKDDDDDKDDDKEEKDDKEEEPDMGDDQNDQESSGEESVDLDSDHLVLQGSGSGKIKGVVIEDSEKEKEKPEKRAIEDDKRATKSTQGKRQCGCGGCGGCGDAFDSGGCDYMGGGCGGACGGVCGGGCGGGCQSCCGTNDWCADGTMCKNCKGGFYPPISCGGCNCGCCPGLTFPVMFGATVNNPGCECCKEKTPPGQCKWPCMWPCCCKCTPPKFEFKPLKPEPVCHCPSPHSHHTACGCHCSKRSKSHVGPVKRDMIMNTAHHFRGFHGFGYMGPFYPGTSVFPYPRPF